MNIDEHELKIDGYAWIMDKSHIDSGRSSSHP